MRHLALIAAPLLLAACNQVEDISVSETWVRLPAVKDRPAAAYFTLHGGPTDRTLAQVTSPLAIRSELHESMTQGAMASMKPIDSVALPAKGKVAFAPGGKHVMLFNVNPIVKPGGGVPLEFLFADGQRYSVQARAVGAGDPAPKF